MYMKFKFYNELVDDAKMIREKVFVQEQGFENEFDDQDNHCLHLVMYKNEQPIACARMYKEDENMIFGRIAVLPLYRHLHIGSEILRVLEDKASELEFHNIVLSAQVRAKEFYLKNGYVEQGNEYLDEYCPHIRMAKRI